MALAHLQVRLSLVSPLEKVSSEICGGETLQKFEVNATLLKEDKKEMKQTQLLHEIFNFASALNSYQMKQMMFQSSFRMCLVLKHKPVSN